MRAAFPHLGLKKAHPKTSRPPLSLFVSHTPPLPPSNPCLSLFVCTVWTIVLVFNYYSTPHQVGKYKSTFLCALENLYNSILNLNETIKTHVEKHPERDLDEEKYQRYWWDKKKWEVFVSCFVFCLVSVILLFFQEAKNVTARQG